MAEHLGKDPKIYADEYTTFCRDIKNFHDIRGTSFHKLPRLDGHEVDLYLLYSLVTSRGGWEKVNINGDWENLLPYFGIHRLCANGPIALKQIYTRYLDVYERVHFLGEEVDRRESEQHEEDDARNRRKALRLLHATPTSYNAAQHFVSDQMRNAAGLSTDSINVTPTERIFLSLLCPLPNEQDFAINVCSLLAMESRRPFPLYQCPRIIDALLAHAGIFSQVDIRELFTESYRKLRGQNLGRFWRDVVSDADIVQLSEEDLVTKEDVTALLGSYWNHLESTSSSSSSAAVSRVGSPTTVQLASNESSTKVGHLIVRPLGCKTANAEFIDMDSTLIEEEESQCSVFENGASRSVLAASPSADAEIASNEPNFKNCLVNTGDAIAEPEVPKENGVDIHSGEILQDSSDSTKLHEVAGTSAAVVAVTETLERKVALPKSKLPTAILKPDNPRAIRYWLDRRQTSRTSIQQESVQSVDDPKEEDFDHEELDIFRLGREQGVHDALGQRVLQVLNVVRNLSFDEVNSSILAQSEGCMRLLLLAAHAKWSCLPQLAFDALSNVASEVNLKDPGDCSLSAILLGTVTRGLESSDRFIVLRCMETLGRLAQRGENESLLISTIDSNVFEKLCTYLTIPDVALLIYTLECVYALSSLGQVTCNAFLRCQGAIDILMSLLTVEAQSYGSKARILMNVVETVAEGENPTVYLQPTAVNPISRSNHSNSPAPSAPSTPPPVLMQPAITSAPSSPAAKILPKPHTTSRPGTPTQSKPVSTANITHAEKEQIAMQWLRATFESLVGASSIEQNVLYKQYVAGCSKLGPKQVLGTVQYFSCVRATFGQNVGPFRKQVGNSVEFYFEGLSPKPSVALVPNSSSPATPIEAPGSPILKAQLCAPPKANSSRKEPPKQSAHPHLSQVLGQGDVASGPAPSSSLIKSLLANKVSESNGPSALGLSPTATALPGMTRTPTTCMNSHATLPVTNPTSVNTQVAQRQHQQRLIQQQQQPITANGPCKSNHHLTLKEPPKMNGICSEAPLTPEEDGKGGSRGMLADLLEREVKKEVVNGGAATVVGKELRIGDNGLELIAKDAKFDMGMVGMNELGVDLGETVPKAAHLIAQVDDSGHVQIHLEEEDASGSVCNGQSLLDQLEACEVSSSTDLPSKAIKRPASPLEKNEIPPEKKVLTNHVDSDRKIAGPSHEESESISNGATNGIVDNVVPVQTPPTLLNTPRTFLILQPQTQQQNRLGVQGVQGQRLLFAIQRPGGVIQHVAMPANVVAISSGQLQTNGSVMTITAAPSNGPIATTTSSVVTTGSLEGVVTFSGGAVAFPAKQTETRNQSLAESHVTITPVPASSVVATGKTNGVETPRGRPTKSKSIDEQQSPSPQPVDPSMPYLCEWKDCMRPFKTPHEVYVHACQTHCPVNIDELGCLWERCDGLKRRRFSMMTHLADRHCNEEVQKMLSARRHQMHTQGKTDIPAPQAPTPHPGYAPHAALHAIKRHAAELMSQKEQEEKEGPVTKSIRLTSALILRNLATHSSLGRRNLQRYESQLASVALSNVESSRTVAQILYELTHQCS